MNEEKTLEKLYSKLDKEYLEIVSFILEHPEFKKRLEYHHHENRSVFVHSLMVSYNAYKVSKFFHLDYKKAALGGLLHDFYYNDWQTSPKRKKKLSEMHGISHPKEALENSKKLFSEVIDKKVSDIIIRHMFPLTIIPPLYPESWVITLVDKYVSLEIFKTPTHLLKYVGIRK